MSILRNAHVPCYFFLQCSHPFLKGPLCILNETLYVMSFTFILPSLGPISSIDLEKNCHLAASIFGVKSPSRLVSGYMSTHPVSVSIDNREHPAALGVFGCHSRIMCL